MMICREHHDAADAGDHAVLQKTLHQSAGQLVVHELAKRRKARRQQSISGCAQANT